MTSRDRAIAILGGLAAGAAGGVFGVGGGILLVPILTGWLRATQHQAHGTSLAVVTATALSGVVVYAWSGHVAWIPALLTGVVSIVAARFGAQYANRLSSRQLTRAFAVFLTLVGIRLFFEKDTGVPWTFTPGWETLAIQAGTGIAAGFLAGVMGVGGGIVLVPAFTLLLGMDQHTAQGTSLAIILLTAPSGAVVHARHGNILRDLILWLSLGAVVGGAVASTLIQQAPGPVLTQAFAVFLLANAALSLYRVSRGPRPGKTPAGDGSRSTDTKPSHN